METQASNFKYVAFISYQRKDEEWAKWFHHQLEYYHLPTDIANGKNDYNSLRPMFLDEAELSGGSLASEIRSALDNSRYLIILCSPNSAKSEWVNLEVQTFINSGRIKSIIPVIVGGAPYSDDSDVECFVPALKSLRGTDKELLAINAQNGKEIASVKIVAQIVGVTFDSLWNRYEHEKELERKKLIEEKRRLQRLESRYLAEKGRDAIAAGNNLLAVKLALRALPENIYDIEDRPFVDEASDMLYHAIESNDGIIANDVSGSVRYAEFSYDGKKIVTCGDAIDIWDSATGALLRHIPYKNNVFYIKFSPDYSKLVGVGTDGVCLLDFKNETLKNRKRGASYNNYAEFSPDGTTIACVTDQSQIVIYDSETLEEIHRLVGHTDVVTALTFLPASDMLFSCSADNTMRVWDTKNGECCDYQNIGDTVYSISFDRTGEKYTIAMSSNQIMVMESESGNQISHLEGHTDRICSAKFSYDGTHVISFSSDKTIRLWDAESGKCIKTITHDLSNKAMQCAALSNDGKKIVSSDSVMKITNLEPGNFHNTRYREIQKSELGGALIKSFSHDSKYLYFCNGQRGENGIEYHKLDLENDVAERLFINVNKPEADPSDNHLESNFYSIAPPSKGVLDALKNLKNQLLGMVEGMFVTPDDQHLVLDINGDDLYLVEAANGKLVRKINVGGKKCRQIYPGWSPGVLLLRVDRDLYSFDLSTLESAWILSLDDYYSKTVDIFADYNGNLYIMQSPVETGRNQETIQVFVYNVFSKQVIRTFQRPTYSGMYIRVLSPNGKYMLLGDRIWDIETGQYRQKLMTNNRKLESVKFSPDGKYLVSTSEHYVTLWDVETGQYFHSIERGNHNNCTVLFSPDGTKCALSSGDGKVMAWDFTPPQALIEKVRDMFAGNELSEYEKQALYIE